MRYLVTGGAGFIGSHLVETLVRRGDEVRVLDNFSSGKRANLAAVREAITLIEGDLRDWETVRAATQGVDYVLHAGALASVPASVDDPLTTHAVNATGTLHILLAAREAGVKRVVFSSSASVYGQQPPPHHEALAPQPLSPYAASKLTGEAYGRAAWEVYGVPFVALRYFNVFGPRQDPASQYAAAIPIFISRLLRGEPPIIFGDGLQARDFIYVADVVEANLRACTSEKAVGQVINVAGGRSVTLLELLDTLNLLLETKHVPVFAPPRAGDVRLSAALITRMQDLLDFTPRVDLATGLMHTITWFKGEL